MITHRRNRVPGRGGLQARIAALAAGALLAGVALVSAGAVQAAHAAGSPIIPDPTRTATLHVVKILRFQGGTNTFPFTGDKLNPTPDYQTLEAEVVSPNCDLESLTILDAKGKPQLDKPCYPGNVAYQVSRVASGIFAGVNYGPVDLTTAAGWQAAQQLTVLQADDQTMAECTAEITDNCLNFSWTSDIKVVDDNGTATFENLPIGLYYVNQTWANAPAGMMLASPFLVTLPMTNQDRNAWMYDVWVYPKGRVLSMELDKTIEKQNSEPGFYVGDIIQYVIAADIPVIWHNTFVQKYKITDQLDPRIVWAHGTGPVIYVDNHSDPRYRLVYNPDEKLSDYRFFYCGTDGSLYRNGEMVADDEMTDLTDLYPLYSGYYFEWLQHYPDGTLPTIEAVCGATTEYGGNTPAFEDGQRVIRKNIMVVELLKGQTPDFWNGDTILPKGDPFPEWWRGLEKLTELSLPDPDCQFECWERLTGSSDAEISVHLFAKAVTQGDKIPNGGWGSGTYVELGLDDNTNSDCLATGDCIDITDVPDTCKDADCNEPSYGGLSLWKYAYDKAEALGLSEDEGDLKAAGYDYFSDPAAGVALPGAEFKLFSSLEAAQAYALLSASDQQAADAEALANYNNYIQMQNDGSYIYYDEDATDCWAGIDTAEPMSGCWEVVEPWPPEIPPELPLVFFTSSPCTGPDHNYLTCNLAGFDDDWNPIFNDSDPFVATVASIAYNKPVISVVTDSIGHAMIGGLVYGDYWVLETTVPRGSDGMRYETPDEPYPVTINGSIDGCYFDALTGPECDPNDADSDRAYRLSHAEFHDDWLIKNVPANATGPMPSVGGPGVLVFGVLALTIAGITLASLKRRRESTGMGA